MKDNIINIEPTAPEQKELPQGTDAFINASKAMHEALYGIHAPFLNRHPGIHGNYIETTKLAKMIGFYVQDSINMIMNPELYPVPEEQDATQEDS